VVAADKQITEAKDNLVKEVRNIPGAVARRILSLSSFDQQEGGRQHLLRRRRKVAVDLNLKELEYHRLDRQRETNEKMLQHVLER